MTIHESWNELFKTKQWGVSPGDAVILFMARHLYFMDRPNTKILDVGCGWGANLWYLAREGFATYGIEGSPVAIERCGEIMQKYAPNWRGEVVQGDICDMPYEEQQFDVVIDIASVTCLDHKDSKKAYDEIYRVLKPGGALLIQSFAPGSWKGAFAKNTYNRVSTEKQMRALLSKFEIVTFTPYNGSLYGHPLNQWWVIASKKKDDIDASGDNGEIKRR